MNPGYRHLLITGGGGGASRFDDSNGKVLLSSLPPQPPPTPQPPNSLLTHQQPPPPRRAFYHLNPEHAQSDANVEIRDGGGVEIYGLKSEGLFNVLWLRNASDVQLYGKSIVWVRVRVRVRVVWQCTPHLS